MHDYLHIHCVSVCVCVFEQVLNIVHIEQYVRKHCVEVLNKYTYTNLQFFIETKQFTEKVYLQDNTIILILQYISANRYSFQS